MGVDPNPKYPEESLSNKNAFLPRSPQRHGLLIHPSRRWCSHRQHRSVSGPPWFCCAVSCACPQGCMNESERPAPCFCGYAKCRANSQATRRFQPSHSRSRRRRGDDALGKDSLLPHRECSCCTFLFSKQPGLSQNLTIGSLLQALASTSSTPSTPRKHTPPANVLNP